ncbi:MAG: ATP-binding cassette domain-containing protein [Candidatus Dormibacteria bacterium]
MAHIDVSHVSYRLGDGSALLDQVSFHISDGSKSALIGPNGGGKTTLLRMLSGDLLPDEGTIGIGGELAVMHQSIGRVSATQSVRQLLASAAAPAVRAGAEKLLASEAAMAKRSCEPTQLAYAQALADWNDVGGYLVEAVWNECCLAALGEPFEAVERRSAGTLSGGEQKRLVLEALLRGQAPLLLLDEPDNFLDVPAKRWLEGKLLETPKTVLMVSHDRELLSRCAQRIVTLEDRSCWVHGGSFAEYPAARRARNLRQEEVLRRWAEERDRIRVMVRTLREQAGMSDAMASRYHAAETRLRHFEEAGPPPAPPRAQAVTMRLGGGRTGVRALTCRRLELPGLIEPFDLELFYGERLAVLGANGTGKSRFLELVAGGGTDLDPPGPTGGERDGWAGSCRLGARVVPGFFAQTYERTTLDGRGSLLAVLDKECSMPRGPAMSALRRYELERQAEHLFDTLSGGQRARFQLLLVELSGATLLVLDEPTGNLDLVSAQALEDGLKAFVGTVVAVTHDRWFARSFSRFLVFEADGGVREWLEPTWEVSKSRRAVG